MKIYRLTLTMPSGKQSHVDHETRDRAEEYQEMFGSTLREYFPEIANETKFDITEIQKETNK